MTASEPTTGPAEDRDLEDREEQAPEVAADERDGADDSPDDRRDRKYRAELRRVEAECDALRAALAEHVRGRVERLAVERGLRDGSAIGLVGDDPLAYADEAFGVDRGKVGKAVEDLLRKAPGLRLVVDFDAGPRSSPSSSGVGWQQALRGRS